MRSTRRMARFSRGCIITGLLLLTGCQCGPQAQAPDGGVVEEEPGDAGDRLDAGTPDAGLVDGGVIEEGPGDAGDRLDAGTPDAGVSDGVVDAGGMDAGLPDADAGLLLISDAGCEPLVLRWVGHQDITSNSYLPEWNARALHVGAGVTWLGGSLAGSVTVRANTSTAQNLNGGTFGRPLLARYADDGGMTFARLFDTQYGDIRTMVVHPDDSVLLGGLFQGQLGIDGGGQAFQVSGLTTNDMDGWFARLDPTGRPLWLKHIGGDGIDTVQAVLEAPDGGFYAGGQFEGDATFGAGEPGTVTLHGVDNWEDPWLARFEEDGRLRWVQQISTTDRYESVLGMQPTPDGLLVIGNINASMATFGLAPQPITMSCGGSASSCGFLARYHDDGTVLWARGVSGTPVMTLLPDGTVAIASLGNATEVVGSGSANPFTLPTAGLYLARFDVQGELLGVSMLATGNVEPTALVSDSRGRLFLTGTLQGETSFATVPTTLRASTPTWTSSFITCGSVSNAVQWVQFADGVLQEYGQAIARGPGDTIVWGGYSRDADAVMPLPSGATLSFPTTMTLMGF